MEWYLKVLKQYADFKGRARRKEFWMFVLFNFLAGVVLSLVDRMFGINLFSGIYGLFVFIPGLAVSIRRLHDIGKSGWMILIAFIPIIGFIWLIVLYATEGTYGENQYGPNPKEDVEFE